MPIQDSDRPYIKRGEHSPLDPDKMYAELEEKIKNCGHPMDLGRIRAAYEMARVAHSGQLRKDGSPYVTHCVAAADISVDMGLDEDSIIAALLHDVIEDTNLTHADIARQFGTAVADIVEGVTKLTRVQYTCARCSWPWPRTSALFSSRLPTACTICARWPISPPKSSA